MPPEDADKQLFIKLLTDIHSKLDSLISTVNNMGIKTSEAIAEHKEKIAQADKKITQLFDFYNESERARNKLNDSWIKRFNAEVKEWETKHKKLEDDLQENKDHDNKDATEKAYGRKVWGWAASASLVGAAIATAFISWLK